MMSYVSRMRRWKFDLQRKIYGLTTLNLPIASLAQGAPAVVFAQEGPALDLFAFFERVFMDGVDGELTARDFVRFMGWDRDDGGRGRHGGNHHNQLCQPILRRQQQLGWNPHLHLQ